MTASLVLLALAACAEAPPAPIDSAPMEVVEPFEPLAGVWTVDALEVPRDECGGILRDAEQGEDEEKERFDLLVEEGEFTIVITFDDGESYPIDCLLDEGTGFDCTGERALYTIDDTTLSLRWSGGGAFEGEGELAASLDATATCDGSLCSVAEAWFETSLPCEGTMAMEASYFEGGP